MKRALTGVLLVTLLAAGCTVNPVTGRRQMDLMGESGEIDLGRRFYPSLIQGSLGPIEDAELEARAQEMGEKMARLSHRPHLEYRFTAVNDPMVNAFALPGGMICITRGMLVRLESEDGMAAVLGHEIGHVTARHAVGHYNRQLLTAALLVGGGILMEVKEVKHREFYALGALIGAQLALAHYSREQERQSDDLGMQYAVAAGFAPRGMVETMDVLASLQRRAPSRVERMFASHPMSENRRRAAEAQAAAHSEEIRQRPLRTAEYRKLTAALIDEQPAWELAQDGRTLLDGGKDAEAVRKLAEAAVLAPTAGVIRTLHGAALAAAGKPGEAISEAVAGARLAPRSFHAQFIAGELLVPREPGNALEHLDSAEKLLPGVAQVSLLRGRALEALRRRDDAIQAYRDAMQRDPSGQVGGEAAQRLEALGVSAAS